MSAEYYDSDSQTYRRRQNPEYKPVHADAPTTLPRMPRRTDREILAQPKTVGTREEHPWRTKALLAEPRRLRDPVDDIPGPWGDKPGSRGTR